MKEEKWRDETFPTGEKEEKDLEIFCSIPEYFTQELSVEFCVVFRLKSIR